HAAPVAQQPAVRQQGAPVSQHAPSGQQPASQQGPSGQHAAPGVQQDGPAFALTKAHPAPATAKKTARATPSTSLVRMEITSVKRVWFKTCSARRRSAAA